MSKPKPVETRITSKSGASKGSKLARFDLIPSGPLRELAEHYGKGAAKYERVGEVDNWRLGYDFGLSIAALHRHLNSFTAGEDIDEETGSKHLIAVAWHAFTLVEYMNTPGFPESYDDRQDTKVNPPNATVESVLRAIAENLGTA